MNDDPANLAGDRDPSRPDGPGASQPGTGAPSQGASAPQAGAGTPSPGSTTAQPTTAQPTTAQPGPGTPPPPPQGPPPQGGVPPQGAGRFPTGGAQEFFDRVRHLGIARPEHGRWAAGVGAGLARRYGIDPLLTRALLVGAELATGLGILFYGLAWALLPQDDGRIHAQQLLRKDVTAGAVGAVLCVLYGLGPGLAAREVFGGQWMWHPGGLLLAAVIVAVVWWSVAGRHHRPVPPAGRAPGTPGTWKGAQGTWYGTPPTPAPGVPPTHPSGGSFPQDQPVPGSPHPTTSHGTTMYSTAASPLSPTPSTHGAVPSSGYAPYPGGYGPPPGGPGPHGPGHPGHGPTPPTPEAARAAWALRDRSRPLHALTTATLGVALVAAGLVGLWDHQIGDVPGGGFLLALATALGVTAAGIVVAGLLGRRAGGLAPIGIILAVVLLLADLASAHGSVNVGGGARHWLVTSRAEAVQEHTLGVGKAVVDLTDERLLREATPTDPVTVNADIGIGELTVVVPRGVPVEVEADVGAGDITRSSVPDGDGFGADQDRDGPSRSETLRYGGSPPAVVVRAKVGLGVIHVDDRGSSEVRS